MRKQNSRLIILVVILGLANLWFFIAPDTDSKLNFDPELFAISDTSQISSVSLKSKVEEVKMTRSSNWKINESYPSDFSYRSMLFAVSLHVRAARVVQGKLKDNLLDKLEDQGILVTYNEEAALSYWVMGNLGKTKTYFITGDKLEVYEVEIPGYRDFVGGIYQLSINQFRDRTVSNGNWRTIQRLDYLDLKTGESFIIKYNKVFFEIEGLEAIDSTEVVSYLDKFRNLQANERISFGQFDRYDSLSKTIPEIKISIDDLKFDDSIILSIFPSLVGENIQLVMNQENEIVLFSSKRLQELYKKKVDFNF